MLLSFDALYRAHVIGASAGVEMFFFFISDCRSGVYSHYRKDIADGADKGMRFRIIITLTLAVDLSIFTISFTYALRVFRLAGLLVAYTGSLGN